MARSSSAAGTSSRATLSELSGERATSAATAGCACNAVIAAVGAESAAPTLAVATFASCAVPLSATAGGETALAMDAAVPRSTRCLSNMGTGILLAGEAALLDAAEAAAARMPGEKRILLYFPGAVAQMAAAMVVAARVAAASEEAVDCGAGLAALVPGRSMTHIRLPDGVDESGTCAAFLCAGSIGAGVAAAARTIRRRVGAASGAGDVVAMGAGRRAVVIAGGNWCGESPVLWARGWARAMRRGAA
mmetsp:Transcript_9496/g.27250  ORF Transcript_9496/g.27250 Transcript_9496/m.27250 type:complete len:248 (+) Transcript_9496:212-955(+)